jgi:hypothetical protein
MSMSLFVFKRMCKTANAANREQLRIEHVMAENEHLSRGLILARRAECKHKVQQPEIG